MPRWPAGCCRRRRSGRGIGQKAERAARRAWEALERYRSQTERLAALRSELDEAQQRHLLLSERNRIAQDLHDRAAQTSYLLALKLDWLIGDLEPADPLREELERLKGLAAEAAAQTREAIFALRAPELSEGGLQGGLRRLLGMRGATASRPSSPSRAPRGPCRGKWRTPCSRWGRRR